MFHLDTLYLTDLTIEHLKTPLGIDTKRTRFRILFGSRYFKGVPWLPIRSLWKAPKVLR